nr:hypothetical protein [Tanacetum cinerariifolium]
MDVAVSTDRIELDCKKLTKGASGFCFFVQNAKMKGLCQVKQIRKLLRRSILYMRLLERLGYLQDVGETPVPEYMSGQLGNMKAERI